MVPFSVTNKATGALWHNLQSVGPNLLLTYRTSSLGLSLILCEMIGWANNSSTSKIEIEHSLTLKSLIQREITHLCPHLQDTYHMPDTMRSANLQQLI